MTVVCKWKYSGRCAQALGLAEFGGIESSHRHSGSDGDAQAQVMLPRVKNDDGVNCARVPLITRPFERAPLAPGAPALRCLPT